MRSALDKRCSIIAARFRAVVITQRPVPSGHGGRAGLRETIGNSPARGVGHDDGAFASLAEQRFVRLMLALGPCKIRDHTAEADPQRIPFRQALVIPRAVRRA
jgi:hypothetical protein